MTAFESDQTDDNVPKGFQATENDSIPNHPAREPVEAQSSILLQRQKKKI